tara:strand:+ start:1833 stop:2084 length:252 start_codon:yes stop_codon:yes gene_type:complete
MTDNYRERIKRRLPAGYAQLNKRGKSHEKHTTDTTEKPKDDPGRAGPDAGDGAIRGTAGDRQEEQDKHRQSDGGEPFWQLRRN